MLQFSLSDNEPLALRLIFIALSSSSNWSSGFSIVSFSNGSALNVADSPSPSESELPIVRLGRKSTRESVSGFHSILKSLPTFLLRLTFRLYEFENDEFVVMKFCELE